ncbi:glutathione S-transferase family protein [Ancylobacter pratisalsi]|uniref:Glutathione S-transferase family protein n=1 Tax=Ancylobacter pratisalsi TaxID=1745854 RepID=A0A6P1YJA6_9HYPH|nr:glutathione S-transferase family protein [Ancylobacter pratisalsi]QIB32751.1 glutathione S-transferase family protein [Ancylobacter pratisalsi]
MKLRSSPASPFGRKAKIAAALCGVPVDIEPTDTTDPNDSVREQNPLGKIPVLLRADAAPLFDSRVIVEFFDAEAGGGCIIPSSGEARFSALTAQALADGLMDAALLQVYEARFRPEEIRSPSWVASQAGKVERAMKAFEAAPPAAGGVSAPANIGEITLACALGYLDLRFAGAWRAQYPALLDWLNSFAARVPAFEATRPPG